MLFESMDGERPGLVLIKPWAVAICEGVPQFPLVAGEPTDSFQLLGR